MFKDEETIKIEFGDLCSKGNDFLKRGKLEEALKVFEYVRNRCSNVPSIHVLIGNILMRMNMYEKAIEHLNRGLELSELDSEESKTESVDAILKNAQKCLLNPQGLSAVDLSNYWGNPKISYSLAICWKKLGKTQKGLDYLKKAAQKLLQESDVSETMLSKGLLESKELSKNLKNALNNVNVFEAAGSFAEAFNLLCSPVYTTIVANDMVKSNAAGR